MVEVKPKQENNEHTRLQSPTQSDADYDAPSSPADGDGESSSKWVIGFNERFSDDEDDYIQLVQPNRERMKDGPTFVSLNNIPYTKKLLIKATDDEAGEDAGLEVTASEMTAYRNKTTIHMTQGTAGGGAPAGFSEQRELTTQSRENLVMDMVKRGHSESSRAKFKATVRDITRKYNQGNRKYKIIAMFFDTFRRFRNKTRRFFIYLQPLYFILHRIEKKFGTGIASFFDLWIQIIYMNMAIFVVTLGLGVVPWFFSSTNISALAITDFSGVLTLFLGLIGVSDEYIGKSFFFYGGYADRDGELLRQWNTPVFYSLFILCYYGISLFIIVVAMGIRLSVVTSMDENIKYSTTILSMWDHRLISKTSIHALKRAVASRLRELLAADDLESQSNRRRGFKEWMILIVRRCTGIILSLLLVASAPTAVYFITQYNDIINSVVPSVTSIVIVIMSTIYPKLLQACVLIEGYNSAFWANANNVIRTFIVKMVIATSLILRVMFPNTTDPDSCVGTKAGMVFWQLLIIDFFSSAASNIIPNFALTAFNSRIKKSEDPKLEFNVSDAINQVLYRQVIIWIGSALCPMLPLLGIISSTALFMLKYIMSLLTIKFPKNPMANAKGSIFNLTMLLITLILSFIPGVFFMLKKDNNCGPFRFDSYPYNVTGEPTTGFNVISNFFQNDERLTAWSAYTDILDTITNPLVLFIVIVILAIVLFFTVQRLRMFRKQALIEVERTKTERQDKIDLSMELQRNTELQMAKSKEVKKLRHSHSKRRFNFRTFSRKSFNKNSPAAKSSKKLTPSPISPQAQPKKDDPLHETIPDETVQPDKDNPPDETVQPDETDQPDESDVIENDTIHQS